MLLSTGPLCGSPRVVQGHHQLCHLSPELCQLPTQLNSLSSLLLQLTDLLLQLLYSVFVCAGLLLLLLLLLGVLFLQLGDEVLLCAGLLPLLHQLQAQVPYHCWLTANAAGTAPSSCSHTSGAESPACGSDTPCHESGPAGGNPYGDIEHSTCLAVQRNHALNFSGHRFPCFICKRQHATLPENGHPPSSA